MNLNEQKYVEKVMNDYQKKDTTKLDTLKALDRKAKLPANVFAYVFGSIGALIMGFGMCVAMQVILADLMVLGIVIGVLGILMVSINYYFYQKLLARGKAKYAEKIQLLSKELLSE